MDQEATIDQELDIVEKISGAMLQHGTFNDRIYVPKLGEANARLLVPELEKLARAKEYGKICVRVPFESRAPFLVAGYRREAMVPRHYGGSDDAVFLARYFTFGREREPNELRMDEILHVAKSKRTESSVKEQPCPPNLDLRTCTPEDISDMTAVYAKVFPIHQFPLQDPEYIRTSMKPDVKYYCADLQGHIVALATVETDSYNRNAEIYDFATLSDQRGGIFIRLLIQKIEADLRARDIQSVYTTSRAIAPPINATISEAGYKFGGRLVNNTNVAGIIESSNVWFKQLIGEAVES